MSKRNEKFVFEGSERELASMTKDLEEFHNDVGVSSMWAGVASMVDSLGGAERVTRSTSRRTFLMGTGAAVVGGAALAAVGAGGPA